ncbi:MAG: respiratory nitrate reductase subunit gamma [Myxococcales bacterium]|nr:respiratory nitrate reductase subunit gamma [Myxococcales bacterium]
MTDKIFYFVMVPMVYLAFAWCIIGVLVKIVGIWRSPKPTHTLKIFPEKSSPTLVGTIEAFTLPTVRRYQPLLWMFLGLFHLGILGLILSHLDLLPQINLLAPESKHMLGNGAIGVIVTVSVVYFLFRRFRTPVREISVPADYLMLFLLFLIFITGDTISWANSWNGADGFVLTKQDFGKYLDSLVRFTFANPREFLMGSHYVVIAVHVLLANLFLLLLPFSKIMHTFFAVPLNWLRRV